MFKLLLIGITPAILQQVTGINVIMYYAPSIFRSAGVGAGSALAGYSFLIYSFLSFACLLFVLKYITETKGKSLEQIEKELVGRTN